MSENVKMYFDWLLSLSTIENVKEEIESIIDKENNSETIKNIISALDNEISACNTLLEEDNDESIKEEKNSIIEKKNILLEVIADYDKKKKNEVKLEEIGASGVLFARNKYGNIMVENDLKTIKKQSSKDVYNWFIKLIEDLMQNKKTFVGTRQKGLTGDSNLKGLYEMKNFQARLLYRYAGDKVVIIGAAIKKTDMDNKYRNFCINAKEQSNGYVELIEKNMLNIEDEETFSTDYYISLVDEEKVKLC